MAKKLYYKIGEACKQLDIQPYVLRYWETEFPALAPSKSKSGQRVYSRKDLEIIGRIKELLYDEGYTISGAKKKLEGELESGGPRTSAPKAAADKPAAKTAKDQAAAGKPDAGGSSDGKAAPAAGKAEAGKPAAKTGEEPSKPLAEKTVPAARSSTSETGQTGRLDTLEKDVKMLREGVQEALKQAKALLNMLDASSDRS